MCGDAMIHVIVHKVARSGGDAGGTAVPPPIGEHEWVKRPVRRGFVVLLPYALAAAIAYGMVASALAVPLAYRGAGSGSAHGPGADCRADAGVALERTATGSEPGTYVGDREPARTTRTRGHDAHAGHAAPIAAAPAEAPASDGDRRPIPDHFECCSTRLGTVGTPALAVALVRRPEPAARRARPAQPRMPSRPRPLRVSLGRHPPAPPIGTTLAA
jgi:hypothetical protein